MYIFYFIFASNLVKNLFLLFFSYTRHVILFICVNSIYLIFKKVQSIFTLSIQNNFLGCWEEANLVCTNFNIFSLFVKNKTKNNCWTPSRLLLIQIGRLSNTSPSLYLRRPDGTRGGNHDQVTRSTFFHLSAAGSYKSSAYNVGHRKNKE